MPPCRFEGAAALPGISAGVVDAVDEARTGVVGLPAVVRVLGKVVIEPDADFVGTAPLIFKEVLVSIRMAPVVVVDFPDDGLPASA
jgi:hypothetical protein